MFFEIFSALWTYIFVLIIIVLCFANCTFSLQEIPDENIEIPDIFNALKSSYTLALGDFGNNETEVTGGTWPSFIIFFISSILMMIIYANILITIVSEGFADVKDKKVQYLYRDKCQIVLMCSFFEDIYLSIWSALGYLYGVGLKIVYYFSWKNSM